MTQPFDLIQYERYAKIGRLIARTYTEVMSALDVELARYDVTAAQYVVISLVARGHAETAAQVCKELSYNPGAMTRMLDRLEQKNLIRRVRIPGDRRSVKLELTPEAEALFPTMFACSAAILERYYGRLKVEELELVGGVLDTLLGNPTEQ